jgi:uncharacterized protein YggE
MKAGNWVRAIILALLPVVSLAHESTGLVSVDGTGIVTAQPDIAHVTMAIQARNIEVSVARDHAIEITRKFIELCEQLDIDDEMIQTSGINIQPEYRWNERSRQQELQGYLVRRQMNVQLVDLEKLGDLIEGAIDAGVNEASPPRLASSRERELHREALAKAAEDAEANARVLAETLDVSLGDVVEIRATQNIIPPPMQRAQMASTMALSAEAGGADTYSVGEIRFQANVTASFALTSE